MPSHPVIRWLEWCCLGAVQRDSEGRMAYFGRVVPAGLRLWIPLSIAAVMLAAAVTAGTVVVRGMWPLWQWGLAYAAGLAAVMGPWLAVLARRGAKETDFRPPGWREQVRNVAALFATFVGPLWLVEWWLAL